MQINLPCSQNDEPVDMLLFCHGVRRLSELTTPWGCLKKKKKRHSSRSPVWCWVQSVWAEGRWLEHTLAHLPLCGTQVPSHNAPVVEMRFRTPPPKEPLLWNARKYQSLLPLTRLPLLFWMARFSARVTYASFLCRLPVSKLRHSPSPLPPPQFAAVIRWTVFDIFFYYYFCFWVTQIASRKLEEL